MTQTINIPEHHGCNLAREQSQWQLFDQARKDWVWINRIEGCAVPSAVRERLGLADRKDLYFFLTSAGQWATTLEHAEYYLLCTEPPTEFLSKGATLGYFFSDKWFEENGTTDTHASYRVFRLPSGRWDIELIETPVLATECYELF
jgi:hypothetical protein